MISVTLNDSSAVCEVTANQKCSQPLPTACQAIAATGSSTIIDSHSVITPTRRGITARRLEQRDTRLRGGLFLGRASWVSDCQGHRVRR